MNADLAALLHAAARGEERAWNALIARFDRAVRAVAARHRLDTADKDEVAQHTWIALYLNIGSIREPNALVGWLRATARNESLRLLRERTRQVPVEEPRDRDATDGTTPEDHLLAREQRDLLHGAIERIPAHEQRLMRLHLDSPSLSYAEMSAALGIPRGSIGPTRGRCIARLRADHQLVALEMAA